MKQYLNLSHYPWAKSPVRQTSVGLVSVGQLSGKRPYTSAENLHHVIQKTSVERLQVENLHDVIKKTISIERLQVAT